MEDQDISSLVSLSETMCQKAKALREKQDSQDLVERGKQLQKLVKAGGKGKGQTASTLNTRNDIQVSCCGMERGRKQSFVKCSDLYEVNLKKTDDYCEVAGKIVNAIGLFGDDVDESQLVLLTSRGCIIPNEPIKVLEMEREWSLGTYLNKRHISPEKLTLGVAKQRNQAQPKAVKKMNPSEVKGPYSCNSEGSSISYMQRAGDRMDHHDDNCEDFSWTSADSDFEGEGVIVVKNTRDNTSKSKSKCPRFAALTDEIKVCYSSKVETIIPKTKLEVWIENDGDCDDMDKSSRAFHPEDFLYQVLQISLHGKDTKSGIVCFNSLPKPKLQLPNPTLLCVVCSSHPNCHCMNKPNMDLPASPVVYVKEPLLYKCSVTSAGNLSQTVHFDVTLDATRLTSGSTTSDELGVNPRSTRNYQKKERTPPKYRPCGHETISIGNPSFHSVAFTFEEIMEATDNLNKSKEIGSGGFGRVFIAHNLKCTGTTAAVKVLTKEGSEALLGTSPSNQIESELKALMKFRHPNILEVMGYSFSMDIKALIYKYMKNGSLYDWIHSECKEPLSWQSRINISKDMLRGVAYLHAGNPPIVHQDIKSHNILLDEHFTAVVGDLGFAVEIPQSVSGRTLITAPLVARSDGYFPSELINGKISPLCDVYSCGIVVLELYTAQKAYSKERPDHELKVHTEDDRCDKESFLSIADPRSSPIVEDTAELFRKVVNKCVTRLSQRPTANEALLMWN